MSQRPLFATLRRILIPAAYGCEVKEALAVAAALGGETVVAGFIRIGPEESLSAGAGQASELRRTLRPLAGESVRIRARVRVSHMPWTEVLEVVEAEDPDLLVLNWPGHLEALGVEAADALARHTARDREGAAEDVGDDGLRGHVPVGRPLAVVGTDTVAGASILLATSAS